VQDLPTRLPKRRAARGALWLQTHQRSGLYTLDSGRISSPTDWPGGATLHFHPTLTRAAHSIDQHSRLY
jgi:hypothetical protein